MSLCFVGFVILASFMAGATASVVGFGIGSLLTPMIALRFGTDAAVLVVALPHLLGGLVRGWRLRHFINRAVLVRFGIFSAMGGLVGAFFFAKLAVDKLNPILGLLLVFTAIAGISGQVERWRPRGALVWILGGLSGFSGGVVGNQGGLRAAALSAFGLSPTAFVATSTAIGVFIDLARTPVYLSGGWRIITTLWPVVTGMALGVVAGTLVGERFLRGLSPAPFRFLISMAIGLLGLWFLFHG